MQREQLKGKEPGAGVIPILDDPKPTKAAAQEPMPISIDNVNGQLAELADINAILTARLAKQRGLMADMQRQLANQSEVVIKQAARIAELEGKSVLRKQNGHRK